MEQKILEYVQTLRDIAFCKKSDEFIPTPYALEVRRKDLHNRLFAEIAKGLHFTKDFSYDDGYERSKEIFSHLDKVFALYEEFPLDLQDTVCVFLLAKDLNKFLSKTEVKFYLEGQTQSIHKIF